MVRVLIPVAALFLCWITVFGSARVLPSSSSTTSVSYSNFTFYVDCNDPYAYRSAISQLREELAKNGYVSYGIPVLPLYVPTTSESTFVLLGLEKVGHCTTLALDVVTANIVGFKVGTNSFFFDDVYARLLDNPLFNDTHKHRLRFDASYDSLDAHGASRWDTELGTYPLNYAVAQIYKYASDDSINIAPSFLVVIQMISEAARFKYIEEKLEANFKEGIVPRCDIFSLEDKWELLSIEIQNSNNGNFSEPVVLQYATCATYEVSTVDEVKSKMGLLLSTKLRTHDEQTMYWPCKGNLIKKLSSMFM